MRLIKSFNVNQARRYVLLASPKITMMGATILGATMAPTVEPELKTPVAKALSFFGNHSAMVLTAAGKFPASSLQIALNERFQQSNHLTVDVVDGRRKKQQCDDGQRMLVGFIGSTSE